jgi:group I intron endonuclease
MRKTKHKKLAGIYKITNKINGKSYIGQSINIYARWNNHIQAMKAGIKNRLYSALKSYGQDNFNWEIIDIVDIKEDKMQDTFDKLDQLEIERIKQFHTFVDDPLCWGYNLDTGGRHKHPSNETIIKLSQSLKLKYENGFTPWNKGKKMTSEQREKWVQARFQSCIEMHEERWELLKNYDRTVLGWVNQASKELNISRNSIRGTCRFLGISFMTKGIYANKTGILDEHWELIKDYDKTKSRWLIKASRETGMSIKHIKTICEKKGVEYKTNRLNSESIKGNHGKLLDNSLIEKRLQKLLKYDFNKYGWMTQAVKETGLSATQLRLILKKAGIIYKVDRHVLQEKVNSIREKLSIYDRTKWGWLAKASRELKMHQVTIIKYCKRFGWEYKTWHKKEIYGTA